MPDTRSTRWAVRGLSALAAILYLGSFALPDYRSHWTGGPDAPAVAQETFFFAEMACTPPRAWRDAVAGSDAWAFVCSLVGRGHTGWWWSPPLDWAGWCGHLAVVVGFGLLAAGRGRGAAVAAALGLVFGLARYGLRETNEAFAAGYYVWLASLAVVGAAGVLLWRSGRSGRHAEPGNAPDRGGISAL